VIKIPELRGIKRAQHRFLFDPLLQCKMTRLSASFLSIALAVANFASAVTVGPVGDIVVANASVTLDGTTRPAVLSGGQFPGTTIVGNKGDRFQLNVVNNQFDSRMLQSTSIVSSLN
jgi:FtsP/CotA-like multicopper oxidase with cupredoxin domain